jgi:hypothetical protein
MLRSDPEIKKYYKEEAAPRCPGQERILSREWRCPSCLRVDEDCLIPLGHGILLETLECGHTQSVPNGFEFMSYGKGSLRINFRKCSSCKTNKPSTPYPPTRVGTGCRTCWPYIEGNNK